MKKIILEDQREVAYVELRDLELLLMFEDILEESFYGKISIIYNDKVLKKNGKFNPLELIKFRYQPHIEFIKNTSLLFDMDEMENVSFDELILMKDKYLFEYLKITESLERMNNFTKDEIKKLKNDALIAYCKYSQIGKCIGLDIKQSREVI